MSTLYQGTLNKLDYVSTKLKNMVDEFYLNNHTNQRFTPTIESVAKLEEELILLDNIINATYADKKDWKLILKYTALADEFRAMR